MRSQIACSSKPLVKVIDNNSEPFLLKIAVLLYFAFCSFCYYIIGGRALYFYLVILVSSLGLLGLLISKKRIRIEAPIGFLLALTYLYVTSFFYSVEANRTMAALQEFAIVLVPILIICGIQFTDRTILNITRVYFFSTLCFVLVLIRQSTEYVSWNARSTINLGTFDINENFLSFILIIPFSYALNILLHKRSEKKLLVRVLCLSVIAVDIYGILLTGSRTALLSIVIVFVSQAITALKQSKHKLRFLALSFLFLLIGFALFIFFIRNMPLYIQMRLLPGRISDTSSRTRIWKSTIDWITSNATTLQILFGTGYGTSISILGSTAHNMFLEVVLENGLVGSIIFTVFLVAFYKRVTFSNNVVVKSLWWGMMVVSMLLSGQTSRFFWFDFLFLYLLSTQQRIITNKTPDQTKER